MLTVFWHTYVFRYKNVSNKIISYKLIALDFFSNLINVLFHFSSLFVTFAFSTHLHTTLKIILKLTQLVLQIVLGIHEGHGAFLYATLHTVQRPALVVTAGGGAAMHGGLVGTRSE